MVRRGDPEGVPIMKTLLTTHGRLSRKQYFFSTTIIVAVTYAFMFIGFLGVSKQGVEVAGKVGVVVAMISAVAQLAVAIRRLHDLGRPGKHLWLVLVPFYGLYFLLILSFAPGAPGTNSYGPDPATS
jgi:uncharacterized membrane protein YhaH (DUF805 family)